MTRNRYNWIPHLLSKKENALHEQLCAQKGVPYRGQYFLSFIDFIHEFRIQIINFIDRKES